MSKVSFISYIQRNKRLAIQRGLNWNITVDSNGRIPKQARRAIHQMLNIPPVPPYTLSNFSFDKACIRKLEERNNFNNGIFQQHLSADWQELIKAAVVNAALFPVRAYGTEMML